MQRRCEIAGIDERINELQARLERKRRTNAQLLSHSQQDSSTCKLSQQYYTLLSSQNRAAGIAFGLANSQTNNNDNGSGGDYGRLNGSGSNIVANNNNVNTLRSSISCGKLMRGYSNNIATVEPLQRNQQQSSEKVQ